MDATDNCRFKVVVIGLSEVGKTALIQRFTGVNINSPHYLKSFILLDKCIYLHLWDIGGDKDEQKKASVDYK